MVTQNDPIADEPAPGPIRRIAVYAIVMVTVLLALGLITATGIRWMKQPMPSSTVVVIADSRLVGAQILVAREGEKPRPPVIIEARHNGHTPLFLEAGSYLIRIEMDGQQVYRTDRPIFVAAGRMYDINLSQATTRPH